MMKENKGITLIALVVTIIVLIILAGVSIAMLTGNNGIITQAKLAKENTENKSAEEKVELAIIGASGNNQLKLTVEKLEDELKKYKGTIQGKEFPVTAIVDGRKFKVDSEGNIKLAEENEEEKIQPGQLVSETQKDNYKDLENNTATIPAGFTVSKILGEQNISTGLVIYDIPKSDIDKVDWTTKDENDEYKVQTLYNQFVWIPVENKEEYERVWNYPSKYYINKVWESSEITPSGSTTTDTGYLPLGIAPDNASAEASENAEKEATLKYNGFFVSRYEAGNEKGTVVSKKDVSVYTNKSQIEFKAIGKTMYDDNNIKSAMCSGIQWDMIMKFIDGKKDSKGNIYDVRIYNSSRHTGNIAASGENLIDKVQNIYDLDGNCYEYVAEKNNTIYPYISRGGYYDLDDEYKASRRTSKYGNADSHTSFRLVLYIL